jgi:putative ABC transport system substrate-binding protein
MTLKRREFITLLGGAAAWPVAARAQQSSQPVIGWLSARAAGLDADDLRAFRQGLAEVGFDSTAIEYRGAEGQNDRLPGLAAELARRRVSVIVSAGAAATRAAKTATTTIPIVFTTAADPVLEGFVASLNRPAAISQAQPTWRPCSGRSGWSYCTRRCPPLPWSPCW